MRSRRFQSVTDLPLQLDSTRADVLGGTAGLQRKAIVNSVNAEEAVLRKRFCLFAKNMARPLLVLTLDRSWHSGTGRGAVCFGKKNCRGRPVRQGIPREDVFIDRLTLTASAQQQAVRRRCARCTEMVKERLGVKTVWEYPTFPFGLPLREQVNTSFFDVSAGTRVGYADSESQFTGDDGGLASF